MVVDSREKYRVGDEFDIPVEVISVAFEGSRKQYEVKVRGHQVLTDWVCAATLRNSRRVGSAPKPLKVGDRVKIFTGKSHGTVLAIHDKVAWVTFDGYGGPATYSLDYLERAG